MIMKSMDEHKFWPKDALVKLPEPHSDARGHIQPLCDLDMKSASLIFTKKNNWRANHYHKTDWHYIYVLSGSFEYYFRKTETQDEIKKLIIKEGDLLFTPPMLDHAMLYTVDTNILVVSKNPRDQKTYEEDTVRIKFKE